MNYTREEHEAAQYDHPEPVIDEPRLDPAQPCPDCGFAMGAHIMDNGEAMCPDDIHAIGDDCLLCGRRYFIMAYATINICNRCRDRIDDAVVEYAARRVGK